METLPVAIEAEQAVLGAVLYLSDLWPTVAAILTEADFYQERHRKLFRLLGAMLERGDAIDIVLVCGAITADQEAYGGLAYVSSLPEKVPSTENVEYYAQAVRDAAIRRRLMETTRLLSEAAQDPRTNTARLLEGARLAIQELTRARGPDIAARMGWLSPGANWLSEAPPPPRWLLYQPHAENDFTLSIRGPGLLRRGKVGILAAAGGAGKTFALCGMALALATHERWLGFFPVGDDVTGRVVLVLGEEDPEELRRRLFAQASLMGIHGRTALSGILALPGAGNPHMALTRPEEESGCETPFAESLLRYLELEAERAGKGWDAIILDPLSRFAGPDVEIDNAAATRLMQVLERFAGLPGNPAVLVAHHTTKTSRASGDLSANSVRGASALTDGARWVGTLEPVEHFDLPQRYARFDVAKSNYAAFPPPVLLVYGPEGGIRAATPAELSHYEDVAFRAREKKRKAPPTETPKPKAKAKVPFTLPEGL
jgi:AAA domain/DnaB-like helicase N terminal domain